MHLCAKSWIKTRNKKIYLSETLSAIEKRLKDTHGDEFMKVRKSTLSADKEILIKRDEIIEAGECTL